MVDNNKNTGTARDLKGSKDATVSGKVMLITSNIISGCKNCGRDRKIFQK
jgi:hypothetical protein